MKLLKHTLFTSFFWHSSRAKRLPFVLFALVGLLLPLAGVAQEAEPEPFPRIVVMPFIPQREYWNGRFHWYEFSNDLALRLEAKLLKKSKRFQFVERQALQALDQEKLLGISGRVGNAARFGEGNGAQLMVFGFIDETSLGEAAIGSGIFKVKRKSLNVRVTLKIVDVRTTNVVQIFEGVEGKDDSTAFAGKAADFGSFFTQDSQNFERNPYRKAFDSALEKMVPQLTMFLSTYTPPPVDAGKGEDIVRWSREIAAEAPITVGETTARNAARREAVQLALHQAVNLYLDPETQKRESAPLQERIYSLPERFAAIEGKPIKEWKEGSTYKTIVRVGVFLTDPKTGSQRSLYSMLREMGTNPSINAKVAVMIPETHLRRPRVPDPAVETAIEKKLKEAGFELVDSKRIMELRDWDWRKIVRAGTFSESQIETLRNGLGADVQYLVWGEAFSQRAEGNNRIDSVAAVAGARAEVKVTRLADGMKLFSDAQSDVLATGSTEEIAGKMALEKAGDLLAARLIPELISQLPAREIQKEISTGGSTSKVRIRKVVIIGWNNYAEAARFVTDLKNVPGISAVKQEGFENPRLILTVETIGKDAEDLGLVLSGDVLLKPYHIEIDSLDNVKVEAHINRNPPPAPKSVPKPKPTKPTKKPKGS